VQARHVRAPVRHPPDAQLLVGEGRRRLPRARQRGGRPLLRRRARRRLGVSEAAELMRFLSAADVERALPMAACIEAMAGALADLARGRIQQPLRTTFAPTAAPGFMVWMPAWRSGGHFGAKLLVIVPGNPARGLDAHQGAITLFDGTSGELRAVVDASAVTAIRTAAV